VCDVMNVLGKLSFTANIALTEPRGKCLRRKESAGASSSAGVVHGARQKSKESICLRFKMARGSLVGLRGY
jgi:hypothetical protein